MRDSWRHFFRRLASAGIVSLATAWSSAVCYAVQLAYDSAADVVYDNGWQAGDNGGFGFGPWNFDGTNTNNPTPGQPDLPDQGNQQAMDDGLKAGTQTSSQYNDIGRSWTLFNKKGKNQGPANGAVGTELAQAGRHFSPLQPGQTLSVVIDNPTERNFFRGYNLKLNTGPDANICYAGDNCSTPVYDPGSITNVWNMQTFEYFSYGQWHWPDNTFPLFDTDTDSGVRISFTLTAPGAYSFTMTPLDHPELAVTRTGTVANSDQIDWLDFQFYNTDSDFYPTKLDSPNATDFYIRSVEITGAAPPGVPGDYNNNGIVDAADYVLWRKGGPLQNEVDTPGTVNAADYTAWRARFGNTSGSGSAIAGATIPEPGTLVLFVTGSVGVLSLGFRQR